VPPGLLGRDELFEAGLALLERERGEVVLVSVQARSARPWGLALLERERGEVVVVEREQVEHEVGDVLTVARVLERLEAGPAVGLNGRDLAVEHRAPDRSLQSLNRRLSRRTVPRSSSARIR
jgi:hypothetical protein